MKLLSEVVDERVTFEENELITKAVNEVAPHELENYGELPEEIEQYGYGAKPAPVDSAETVLKVLDDPSWETAYFAQSFLRGGQASVEGMERAVENLSEL